MADRVTEIRTHHREDMAERPGITRRKLLRWGLVTAGLGVPIGVGAEPAANALSQPEVEEPVSDPQGIYEGKVRIVWKGSTLRRDPTRSDVFEKDEDGRDVNVNNISWDLIDTFNGVPMGGVKEFFIDNPEIAWGYNPDGGSGPSPWIRLRSVKKWPLLPNPFKRKEGYLYQCISNKTRDGVQPIGIGKIHKFQRTDGGTVITDTKQFKKSDIGKITFPDGPTKTT